MIAMVACGQGLALMPELMFRRRVPPAQGVRSCSWNQPPSAPSGWRACRACFLSPAAREFVKHAREFARKEAAR